MVLFAPMLKKWIEERARQETHERWEAWLKRREEAEANNLPFTEPPPSEAR